MWTTRTRSARRALVQVMAIRAWQLEHEGRFPEHLDDIVPDELASLPVNPYSGKPFGYITYAEANPSSVTMVYLSGGMGNPATLPKETRLLSSVGPNGLDVLKVNAAPGTHWTISCSRSRRWTSRRDGDHSADRRASWGHRRSGSTPATPGLGVLAPGVALHQPRGRNPLGHRPSGSTPATPGLGVLAPGVAGVEPDRPACPQGKRPRPQGWLGSSPKGDAPRGRSSDQSSRPQGWLGSSPKGDAPRGRSSDQSSRPQGWLGSSPKGDAPRGRSSDQSSRPQGWLGSSPKGDAPRGRSSDQSSRPQGWLGSSPKGDAPRGRSSDQSSRPQGWLGSSPKGDAPRGRGPDRRGAPAGRYQTLPNTITRVVPTPKGCDPESDHIGLSPHTNPRSTMASRRRERPDHA